MATEVSIYQLTKSPLEKILPKLMEKVIQGEKRAVILASSKDRVEELTRILWTYSTLTFLPHGSAEDDFATEQPIWLTSELENPNNAEVLVLCDGADVPDTQGFLRCLDLFDGNDPQATEQARQRVKRYRDQGCQVSFWQQGPDGAWGKK